ncbi:MAG: gluconeogenesis factor YvcK family protein [Oscillospiraceae bacterium]|nr:gluconeogenesis factor YvcK family protein [Oscillospiraceae bacterium]
MSKLIGAQPLYHYESETKVYVPRQREPRIVAIGGGHGQSTVLRGLKRYTTQLTGIVAVSDDGGGSGVLREDLGILPPGDIRNCIMALSNAEPMLEKLMTYRFSTGSLGGQSMGNLLLAAMSEICGSFEEAVRQLCELLAVTGKVLPVTDESIFLEAEFENGRTTLGESKIYYDKKVNNCRIREVRLVPRRPKALGDSVQEILNADLIVIGPGSLYTSIIPNFLVEGITEAVAASRALKLFIMNVMTQDGETEGYTGIDHLKAFCAHAAPGLVDVCIANSASVDPGVAEAYRREDSEPIRLCREEIEALGIEVVEKPLTAHSRFARHDAEKLSAAIMEVFEKKRREC